MKAEYLDILNHIQRDPATGFPVFNDVRLMVIGVGALGEFKRDLSRLLSQQDVAPIVASLGYNTGAGLGMSLGEMFQWDSVTEVFRAGCHMCNYAGLAIDQLDDLQWDEATGHLRFSGRWRHSFEAHLRLVNNGPADRPVCFMLCGMLSGLASAIFGLEVWVQEHTCAVQGHAHCTFEGRPIDQWGEDPEAIRRRYSLERLDVGLDTLRDKLAQAQRELSEQQAEIERLRRPGPPPEAPGVVFRSKDMADTLELARKVAPSGATLLIQGESGVGKEILARFIHDNSGRGAKPFLAINCAALPPALLESELFGHVRGAFTGAERDKPGLFKEAGGGTVFLDEVGELPLELQAKLLRALQEKEIRPVGGTRGVAVEARIIAASNRDLREMAEQGALRQDLYYRLAVFPIAVPPLRRRRQDILPLADHFRKKLAPGHMGFTPRTARAMEAHDWPGNVRELENAVEYALVLAGEEAIRPEHLPASVSTGRGASCGRLADDMPTQDELLRRYTAMVLEATGGNRGQAARILGIGVNTLWRRLNRWGAKQPQGHSNLD